MGENLQTLLFRLDEQLFAIPVAMVERVVRAVRITVLPEAPPFILGIINAWAQMVPVFALRQRLGLPARPLQAADRMILTGGELPLCFVADEVVGVHPFAQPELRIPEEIHPELATFLAGVANVGAETVLVFDRQLLFSGVALEETRQFLAAHREGLHARRHD